MACDSKAGRSALSLARAKRIGLINLASIGPVDVVRQKGALIVEAVAASGYQSEVALPALHLVLAWRMVAGLYSGAQ